MAAMIVLWMLVTSVLSSKVADLRGRAVSSLSQLRATATEEDPKETENLTEEDAKNLKYAQDVIAEVQTRMHASQNASSHLDASKQAFCGSHTEELQAALNETQTELQQEQEQLAKMKHNSTNCGCCCDDVMSIKAALVRAQHDVDFQRLKLQSLDEQVDQIRAWCQ
eukprot:TRINITY_DN5630_c0_g1_i3.p1 TRINITY_DN5630_c0_g1~~TRINITY_DN5630_c0_g1_i3.p1  ORF type:complete len:167 (-),score=54.97 TRINITY_DN5630_c0_g1_i3:65-565(-)